MDLESAKKLLNLQNGCIILHEQRLHCYPNPTTALASLLERKLNFVGSTVACNQVDLATAYLAINLGVKEVFGKAFGKGAFNLLSSYGVNCSFECVVEDLTFDNDNRLQLEKDLQSVDNPHTALVEIKIALSKE